MSTEDQLFKKLLELSTLGRKLVAIAGPPGAGKSTLSSAICNRLNGQSSNLCAILPMDGFHFDDAVLREKGTLHRKGAPFTFDVGGIKSILHRLKDNEEAEIAVPVFDRTIEISRGSARIIAQETPLILAEGNYLLLDEEPWCRLRPYFDYTVMISTSLEELQARLVERWLDHGFSRDDAIHRALENDLPNAKVVIEHSQDTEIDILLTGETDNISP